jgi:PST family polysaccharide transporter
MVSIKKLRHHLVNLKRDSDNKRLIENFFSLSVLQAANYLLPLITLPYLTRVLGPEKFGLIAFAQAFIFYFQVITDYGFTVTATRDISFNRTDKQKISQIFSSVFTIKIGLTILTFLFLVLLIFIIKKFRADWDLYLLTFGIVFGNTLFPVWFFQGIERMKYITGLNILSKALFTLSIFIIVKSPSDYLLVPLLNSIGFIIAGSLGFVIALIYFKVNLKIPNWIIIKTHLKDGWYIFLSGLSGNLYGQGTIFIIGILAPREIVGYYSVAEKLVKSIIGLSQPVAQTLLPFLSNKVKDILVFKGIYERTLKFTLIFAFIIFAVTLFLSKPIYILISGYDAEIGITSMRILSTLIFFTILNVILYPFLIALKTDKVLFKIYVIVGLNFLWICILLTLRFSYIGTSVSIILVEITIFLFGLIICHKQLKKELGAEF